MSKFDVEEIKEEPGILGKIFGNLRKQLDRIVEKYQTMGGEVDKIYVQLKKYEEEIKQSNRKLNQMFEANVQYYHELVKYILAGEQGCRELEDYIIKRQSDMELTGDNSIQFEIQSLQQALVMLEQRTQDLRTAENVAMQSIPMIKTMEFSNMNLVRKINSAFIITLPVFKQALAQAIMLKRQRVQAEAMSALDEKTNELLIKNARNTAEQSRLTAALASGSSIKVDTLETTWRTIMNGIEETKQIQEIARQKRVEDQARLEMIKTEFFDARYASDVKELDSIPAGYINKTVCGCGLTSLAIEKEKGNTIIAVPSVDLVNNKVSQYPNTRFTDQLLGVTGDTDRDDVDAFVAQRGHKPFKIMVTYDSINKVKHLLPYSHLVIDESDRLLSWMPIKAASRKVSNIATANEAMDVINNLLDIAELYKESVSFISATPVPIEYFKRDWMNEIDHITFNWSKSITSQPILMERSFPLIALKDEIIIPLRRDGQVTIGGCTFKKVLVFFNSVEGVNQLIEEALLPLDECGIKCGDSLRNATHTKVQRLSGCTNFPKYTFITSSAFSGSDIYDEEAMTIVVSNTRRNWQMIDI